jgi:hypothetical protein
MMVSYMLPVGLDTGLVNRICAVTAERAQARRNLISMIQKRRVSMISKFLITALLAISLPGMIAAQAMTGEKAEAAKKEIMKIEDEKVAGLLRGGSEPVDWIKQYDAEDVAQTNIDGTSPTKTEIEAGLQPGVFKMHSMKQDGHRFRVYDNGNVAVVTYHALGVLERNGKVTRRESNFSDVWVKQNGAWLRVLHSEREITKTSGAAQ